MKYISLLVILVFACTSQITVNAQTHKYARVISENANLRDAPSNSGASAEVIPEGTLIKVLDEKLPWFIVRVRDRVGWMHGNTLEFIGIQPPVSGSSNEQSVAPDYTTPTPPPRRREALPETPRVDRSYDRGPRGGCYYISGSGRKIYIDRSMCN
ncbi:MAG: SH3 domain-containing protein [Pyrinomonadaceae bacterium]